MRKGTLWIGAAMAVGMGEEVQAVDTVALSFGWNSRQGKVIGPAKIENAKTQVKGTRDTMDARIAPVLMLLSGDGCGS